MMIPRRKVKDKSHDHNETNVENVTKVNDATNEGVRTEKVLQTPTYETVYATAEVKSTKTSITDVEINALNCILKSKDHLVRNIKRIESGVCKSVIDRENVYQHLLPLIFTVDTTHLWENARSYIYHHLGRDTWTKDGTEIRLVRIHRK